MYNNVYNEIKVKENVRITVLILHTDPAFSNFSFIMDMLVPTSKTE